MVPAVVLVVCLAAGAATETSAAVGLAELHGGPEALLPLKESSPDGQSD